jgi:TM2 domain-containing membrane protein YozV
MNVKCVECEKEYVLSENEDPEKFGCECGGNLEVTNENKENVRPVPTQRVNREYYQKEKSPLLALILSFFIPGLGQFYNGHGEKGIIFLVSGIVSAILVFFIIGAVLYLIVWVFAMFDAFDSADRINKGKEVKLKITDYF